MKSLKELDLNNKRVLINTDFNVCLENKEIINQKIEEIVGTIKYVLNQSAKAILFSHSKKDDKLDSFEPIAQQICNALEKEVYFSKFFFGQAIDYALEKTAFGQLLVLESADKKDDEEFIDYWIENADIFVNEDLNTKLVNDKLINQLSKNIISSNGLGLDKKINVLDKIVNEQLTKPIVAILSGNAEKINIDAFEKLLKIVDKVLIGGNLVATFLKAKGYDTGDSYVNSAKLEELKKIIKEYDKKIILPIDFYCYKNDEIKNPELQENKIQDGYKFLDIGKATFELYAKEISDAKTIIIENMLSSNKEALAGTFQLLKAITNLDDVELIGFGDDLIEIINKLKFNKKFSLLENNSDTLYEYICEKIPTVIEVLK